MIIQDGFRRQFYEIIKKEHIFIAVNADVDALCAAAILTTILSCDEVTYSLNPINSIDGLKDSLKIHGEQIKHILLINCISSNSLLDINLPKNATVWVLESRRPIHLDNIYNADTIKVLVPNSELEDWQIPDAAEIFDPGQSSNEEEQEDEEEAEFEFDEGDDSNEISQMIGDGDEAGNEENEEEDGQANASTGEKRRGGQLGKRPAKRAREREELANVIGRRALKRQRRAQWKRTRGALLWEYYMKNWYAAPVSIFMLELAHELGRSSAELMWCAAVGISSQYIDQLISLEKYTEICMDRMQNFIRKYGPRSGQSQEQTRNQLRISFGKELILPLYTHWSLYESLSNESIFICQSKLWSQRGEEKFKEILSQLGLTLAECNQNYEVMKRDRRKEVFEILMKHMDTGFASFISHIGFNTNYNAIDFARVLSLKLECKQGSPSSNEELCQRFQSANELLRDFFKTGGREQLALNRAIDSYKMALRNLNEAVKQSIVQKHVNLRSRYFLLVLTEQCPVLSYFSSRHFLFLFTHSMHRAYASQTKSSRRTKPFVLALPVMEEDGEWFMITGVMPLAELMADSSRKSLIGSAFKHVAKEASMDIRHSFEPNIVMIRAVDRHRFFGNLDARLESV